MKKLYLSFGIMGVIAFATTATAIFYLLGLRNAIKDLSGRSEDAIYYAGQIDAITSDFQTEQRGMIFRGMNHQEEQSDQLMKDNEASLKSLRKYAELYGSVIRSPQAIAGLKIVMHNLAVVEGQNPASLDQVRQNHFDAATNLLDAGLARATDGASWRSAALPDLQSKSTLESGKLHMQSAGRAVWISLFVLLPLTGAGIAVWLIVRRLDAEQRQNVEEIRGGSAQIASAAAEVTSSREALVRDASQQAAMIEETFASSEQINAMARRNIEHASTADRQMAELKQLMACSSAQMVAATAAMTEIGQASDRISSVIKAIDKIAFHTNIFALNAAVGAARAGASGMGFAVVAEEVRSLAQQCASTAQNTEVLIVESQTTAKNGHDRVTRVGGEIRRMADVLGSMTVLVSQINAGSKEQSHGIGQISRSTTLMEEATQRSAFAAEESAAAVEQLTSQSAILNHVAGTPGAMVGVAQSNPGSQRQRLVPCRRLIS